MSNKQSDSLYTIVHRQHKHISPEQYMYDYKMEYITKFRRAHLDESTIKQRVLSKKIGISESILNRFRKDPNMISFYTNQTKKINNAISTDKNE